MNDTAKRMQRVAALRRAHKGDPDKVKEAIEAGDGSPEEKKQQHKLAANMHRVAKSWGATVDLTEPMEKVETFSKPGTADVTPSDAEKVEPLARHYLAQPKPFTSCVVDQRKHGLSEDHANRRCAVLLDKFDPKRLHHSRPVGKAAEAEAPAVEPAALEALDREAGVEATVSAALKARSARAGRRAGRVHERKSGRAEGAYTMLGQLGHTRSGFQQRLRLFQEHHGLPVTGKLDDATFARVREEHLKLKAGERGPWDPKQHPRKPKGNSGGGQFSRG